MSVKINKTSWSKLLKRKFPCERKRSVASQASEKKNRGCSDQTKLLIINELNQLTSDKLLSDNCRGIDFSAN